MENQNQNTPVKSQISTSPLNEGGEAYSTNTLNNLPQSESLEEATPSAPTSTVSSSVTYEQPAQPRRKLLKPILIITAVALLLIASVAGALFYLTKKQARTTQAGQTLSDQTVSVVSSGNDDLTVLNLKGSENKLVVNGDVISRGTLSLAGGNNYYGQFVFSGLTGNRQYTLPDANGTFCLDSNNCNYALESAVVTTSIDGVSGTITLGNGLSIQGNTLSGTTATSLNGIDGAIVLQGTTNRVNIAQSGQTITVSTPQDIATSSSPTFASIALTGIGTQGGNTLCDISNNCGYAGGANAFIQGGNSFGAAAVLGTNDTQSLSFRTDGTNRLTIDTSGNVDIAKSLELGSTAGGAGNCSTIFGVISCDTIFDTGEIYTGTANPTYGIYNIVGLSPTGTNTGGGFGQHNQLLLLGSNNFTSSYYGTYTLAATASSGTVANLIGHQTNVSVAGGTVTNAYGWVSAMLNQANIINAYGSYLQAPDNSGTITNNYGLYIEGRTGGTSSNYNLYSAGTGSNYFGGNIIANTLGAGDTATYLCQNSSNQIASCSGTATGSAFVQGGNSFGTTATLGTNDSNNLVFETDGVDRVTIDTTGNIGVSAASNGAKLYVPYQTGDIGEATGIGPGLTGITNALVQVGDLNNTNNNLIAVSGESYSGSGIQGASQTGTGVTGVSNGSGGTGTSAGVLGVNLTSGGAGVVGIGGLWGSGDGIGVAGYSGTTYGVWGQSANGISGFFQSTCTGLFGCSGSSALPTLVTQQYSSSTTDLFQAQDSSGNARFAIGYNGHTGIGNGNNAAIDDCTMFSALLSGATCSDVLNIQENITDFSKDYVSGIANQIQLSGGNGSSVTSTIQAIGNTVVTANDTADYLIVRGDATSVVHQGTGTITFGEAAHLTVNNTGNGTIGFAKGLQADAVNTGNGSIGFATGISGNAYNTSTGSITNVSGIDAAAGNIGSGNVTNSYGLTVATGNQGSGSIGANYGVQIQSAVNSGGGTVTDNYGLYVQDQSNVGSSNNYNIYSAGSGHNLFQGHTAIGANAAIDDSTAFDTISSYNNVLTVEETITDTTSANYINGIASLLQVNPNGGGGLVAASMSGASVVGSTDATGLGVVGQNVLSVTDSSSTGALAAIAGQLVVASRQGSGNLTGSLYGALVGQTVIATNVNTSGSTANVLGAFNLATNYGTSDGPVTGSSGIVENQGTINGQGLYGLGYSVTNDPTGTITGDVTGLTLSVTNSGTVSGDVSGITIENGGGLEYGIKVATPSGYALWLGNDADNTSANAGIAFGQSQDTNLYRSAVGTLETDGALVAGGAANVVQLTVQGNASQSANLQEWQNSGGTVLSAIRSDGNLYGAANGTSSLAVYTNSANTMSCFNAAGLAINTGSCANPSIGLYVRPWQFNNVGVVVKGQSGQTSDLQQWQNDSGNILSAIDSAGKLQFADGSGGAVDTNLYRGAADTLKTDDSLDVGTKLQVGSGTGPIGQCITATGLVVGNCTADFNTNSTDTITPTYGISNLTTVTPAGMSNTQSNKALNNALLLSGTQSFSGSNYGADNQAYSNTTAGTIATLAGSSNYAAHIGFGGIVTNLIGAQAGVVQGAGTVTNGYGVYVLSAGGSIGTNYGIQVKAQTAGTSDYGVSVEAADTQTLWLSSNADNTTAAAGIAFGSSRDTSLYRGAATQLNTDGDLKVGSQLAVGSTASISTNTVLKVAETYTATSGNIYGTNNVITYDPSGATTASVYGGVSQVQTQAANAQNISAIVGSQGRVDHNGTGTVSTIYGQYGYVGGASGSGAITTGVGSVGQVDNFSSSTYTQSIGSLGISKNGAGGTITTAIGTLSNIQNTSTGTIGSAYGSSSLVLNTNASGTITTAVGYYAQNATNVGTITSNYGILVDAQTAGTSDYGVAIGAADTQTLWLSSNADNTTAAAGIALGSSRDTNLYRGAADQLKTDSSLVVNDANGISIGTGTVASSGVLRLENNKNIAWRNAANSGDITAGVNASDIFQVTSPASDGSTVAQFNNAGATNCTVQPGGTGFACSSDARLKTNVVSIADGLDIVRQLRGVNFNWISNPNGQTQSGFLAQELMQIIPDAVSQDSNGYYVANYSAIIPYLVGAAQQQDLQVTGIQQTQTAHEEAIAAADNQISDLEQRVSNLEAAQPQGNNNSFADLNISGMTTTHNLTVTGAATIAKLTVTGDAKITGNLTIGGHVLGNSDTRGTITVPAGQTQFKFTFTTPYTAGAEPNVILTPKNAFAPNYRVESTDKDFTVYFEAAAATDVQINYQVQE